MSSGQANDDKLLEQAIALLHSHGFQTQKRLWSAGSTLHVFRRGAETNVLSPLAFSAYIILDLSQPEIVIPPVRLETKFADFLKAASFLIQTYGSDIPHEFP